MAYDIDDSPYDAANRGFGNGLVLSLIFWAVIAGIGLAVFHYGIFSRP